MNIKEIRSNLEHLQKLEQSLGVRATSLNPLRAELRSKMENLPVETNGMAANKRISYFMLCGGQWYPCHAGYESDREGWLNYRIDYQDGSSESGVAKPWEWAHCTVDNTPNYHWIEVEG
jgi:hypothetical protein